MTIAERIKANLERLNAALPEGGKAEPPAGEMGMPPPGMAPPAQAKKPKKMAPPPPAESEEEYGDGDDEGEATKSFYDGCKNKKCGGCVPCIERASAEASKSADAATAEVGAGVLAKLIGGAVRAELDRLGIGARFKGIEERLEVVSLGVNGALDVGLKSAEAMGHLAAQPVAAASRPGVAAGARNPAATRSGAGGDANTQAKPFPLTEPEVLKAIHAGLMDMGAAQSWWNQGHPAGSGEAGFYVPPPAGIPSNIVEATKALP